MVQKIKDYHKDFEEAEKLGKFIGVLRKFNNGYYLDSKLRTGLWVHFKYKWSKDKN